MYARDNYVYKNVKCSESLFDKKHLDMTLKKDVGILQFGTIGLNRGDDAKREEKILNKTETNYTKSTIAEPRGITIEKQKTRSTSQSSFLPVHMQHCNGRLALGQRTYQTIKANNFQERGYLDPKTTLNSRKDFWVDPKKQKKNKINAALGKDKDYKKKNLTFNQLLGKYGYIQDDGFAKKERIRPWHILKTKNTMSDSDSSDEN